jgi:hypothetical protein
MNRSVMSFDKEALERQGVLEEVNRLITMLNDMESDWRECARTGKSLCFFCEHDDTCMCTNDADCNFKWKPHN